MKKMMLLLTILLTNITFANYHPPTPAQNVGSLLQYVEGTIEHLRGMTDDVTELAVCGEANLINIQMNKFNSQINFWRRNPTSLNRERNRKMFFSDTVINIVERCRTGGLGSNVTLDQSSLIYDLNVLREELMQERESAINDYNRDIMGEVERCTIVNSSNREEVIYKIVNTIKGNTETLDQ